MSLPAPAAAGDHFVGELTLQRARPLFSGPQVERVRELQFQRPEPVVELAAEDAERRGIVSGDAVEVRSNGTSVALRARVCRTLVTGIARIADEHAADLHAVVEVVKA
jgi:anaerobic selenocysteine-containing dehydrogenase